MTLDTAIENLEVDISKLLKKFSDDTGREVKEIDVRYNTESQSGKRICLLTPCITIYDE